MMRDDTTYALVLRTCRFALAAIAIASIFA
jgi:hypothetical protein